jgi:hypothetical protein
MLRFYSKKILFQQDFKPIFYIVCLTNLSLKFFFNVKSMNFYDFYKNTGRLLSIFHILLFNIFSVVLCRIMVLGLKCRASPSIVYPYCIVI